MNSNGTGKKPPVMATLKRLVSTAVSGDKSLIPLTVAYTFTAALYPLPAVVLPRLVIDELTGTAQAERLFLIVALFVASAGVLGFLSTYFEQVSSIAIMARRTWYHGRITERILSMDYTYCEDDTFESRYEKAFQSVSNDSEGVEGTLTALFHSPAQVLTIAALSIFLAFKSPLILVAILINIAAVTIVERKAYEYSYSLREKTGHANRRLSYFINSASDFSYGKDIRMYGFRERIRDNIARELSGYTAVLRLVSMRRFTLSFVTLVTLILSDAATYGLLVRDAYFGMSIAELSMYLAAAAALSLYLKKFSANITKVLDNANYISDLYKFFDDDLEPTGGKLEAIEGDTLELEFRDVSFKYPRTEKYIIEHLDLTIHKGEKLALVGVNGAGKTTLVKLMTGLFPITSGELLINGTPIGRFTKRAQYKMFSAVFQDVNTPAYTILENVAGSFDGDRERARRALELAGLWEKVESLPKGLDTVMLKVIDEDGVIFSGGEAQKLAIARALYKNANMVIMDEPTAALDALAEADIYERFSELTGGKTALYISHRLASTRFCDRIILLDGAHIAEEGTHEELLALGGKYAEMFRVQGKYYSNADAKGGEA